MGDYFVIYDGEDITSAQLQKLDYSFNYLLQKDITSAQQLNLDEDDLIEYKVYQRKTISGTGKYMATQFITDDHAVQRGFRTYFHRIPIDPICSEWLNPTSLILASPEYPNMDCTWIITAPIGTTMSINFQNFKVKIS